MPKLVFPRCSARFPGTYVHAADQGQHSGTGEMTLLRATPTTRDLQLGMEATFAKTRDGDGHRRVRGRDGRRNPVHLDEAYAAKTIFKTRSRTAC